MYVFHIDLIAVLLSTTTHCFIGKPKIVLLQRNIQLIEENPFPGIVMTLIVHKQDLKLFFLS